MSRQWSTCFMLCCMIISGYIIRIDLTHSHLGCYFGWALYLYMLFGQLARCVLLALFPVCWPVIMVLARCVLLALFPVCWPVIMVLARCVLLAMFPVCWPVIMVRFRQYLVTTLGCTVPTTTAWMVLQALNSDRAGQRVSIHLIPRGKCLWMPKENKIENLGYLQACKPTFLWKCLLSHSVFCTWYFGI